jgi:AcrR family transcriptional regulator
MPRTARPPAKKPRKRASRRSTEEVRSLIVGAASELFAERGYNQTTMRDVASAAGIGLSVLYRQFESKERLFSATLVAPFLESFENFRANRTPPDGASSEEEVVGAFVRDLHHSLETHRRTMVTLLAALEDPDTELIDQVRAGLGDAWRNLQLAAPNSPDESAADHDRVRDANMLVIALTVGLVVFQPWVVAARDGDDGPLVELAGRFSAAGIEAALGDSVRPTISTRP